MSVRNNLGHWRVNSTLLAAPGKANADDPSGVIIRALWQKLKDDLPKVH